jgi:outer membrane biosynthesis protein TonB
MRAPAKCVALLLPLFLAACAHKNDQAQNKPLAPPLVDNPNPAPTPTTIPPPVTSVPTTPTAQITPPAQPEGKPVKKPAHHKTDNKSEQASNASATPTVSAIGQLSPGDPADLRLQTEESIASTEHGLKDMNRQLNDQEQKTVAQIREFLKQARTALTSGDVDGAHTLALKAKVLFGEISQ